MLFLLPKQTPKASPHSSKLIGHARVAAQKAINLRSNGRRQFFLQKADYCFYRSRCFVFWQSRSFNQALNNLVHIHTL